MGFNFDAWFRGKTRERMRIYGRPRWLRWRRDLFKFVSDELKVRESELWDRIAELKQLHSYWMDDTCLLEIVKEEGIEIPEHLFLSSYFHDQPPPPKSWEKCSVTLGKAP